MNLKSKFGQLTREHTSSTLDIGLQILEATSPVLQLIAGPRASHVIQIALTSPSYKSQYALRKTLSALSRSA